jgi:hypothetical protein
MTMTKKTKRPRKVMLLVSIGDDLMVFEASSERTITATDVRRGMSAFNYALRVKAATSQKRSKQNERNDARAN